MWQDIVMGICGIAFSYALFPQIVLHYKIEVVELSWQTINITVLGLFGMFVCTLTLKLWFTSIINLLCMCMWIIFGIQKKLYQ